MTSRTLLPPHHPWQVRYYDCVESTNTLAKEMASHGTAHGTVLIADRQTGGRGCRGRTFLSPAGMGIYMSVILKTDCPPEALMHLTCAAAVAMCDAVEASAGFRPGIKWINDLIWGKRKLAGILTELILSPDSKTARYAIVGIGINCRQTEADFDPLIRDMACSVNMATGKDISRHILATNMILSLERMWKNLFSDKESIMARYRENCITLGKDILIHRGDEIRQGFAMDMDVNGGLVVRYPDGQAQTVNSGEVSVRGMYGYN